MTNIEGRRQAEAAIDRERLAADPGSVLGAEKSYNISNVVWGPNSLQGGVCHDVPFQEAIHFFPKHMGRVSVHKSRIDAVDTDTLRGEFAGQIGGEDFEGALGSGQSPTQGDVAPGIDA